MLRFPNDSAVIVGYTGRTGESAGRVPANWADLPMLAGAERCYIFI